MNEAFVIKLMEIWLKHFENCKENLSKFDRLAYLERYLMLGKSYEKELNLK